MSGTTELADLYSVIEESSRLLDVPFSREKVLPILTAYEDVIRRQSWIQLRVETGVRRAGDFSCRLGVPKDIDPYAIALSNGLTAETDHPVGTLLSEIQGRCAIANHGVDFGVVGGFMKTFQFFPPDDVQELSSLVDIPSMPRSLAENASFFVRYGVDDRACLTGIDYQHKTMNVYFKKPDGQLEPKTITSMLREIKLPDPSEQMLKVGQEASGFYVTLAWDSSEIQRICFSAMTSDLTALTDRLDPKIEKLAGSAPYDDAAGGRRFIYYVASSAYGEYHKLTTFYRSESQVMRLWRSYEDNDGRTRDGQAAGQVAVAPAGDDG
jgi:hypothetical protein